VLGVLLATGSTLPEACGALAECRAPPGRMELSGGSGLPLAIVDYAHTPDALDKALRAARAHCAGKLICVFGCGGERDRGKRSEMGHIVESLADALASRTTIRAANPAHRRYTSLAASPRPLVPPCSFDRAAASPRRWRRRSGDVAGGGQVP
jgi:UDP-N-acetylmuramoyl-L-alanyl-D-glutamate--2,6-diaminopimelate ligase